MRGFVCGAATALLALGSMATATAQDAPKLVACPSEEVIRAAIQKRAIEFNTGAPGVKSIGGFQFSAIAYGEIVRELKVREFSDPVDVCPLVVNYRYVLTANNGEQMHRIWPEHTIHYFFKNEDGSWNYRTGDQVN